MPDIAAWDGFYVIVGSAAGALIGLQFVVMTLVAERPPVDVEGASAAFASPTIVHFGAVLLLSALLHVPLQTITIVASLWGFMGFIGLVYMATVTVRMRRQSAYRPGLEDWLFHVMSPFASYATLAGSSLAAPGHAREALLGVGAAALLLLFTGIHNAWDGASYHVLVNRRLSEQRPDKKN